MIWASVFLGGSFLIFTGAIFEVITWKRLDVGIELVALLRALPVFMVGGNAEHRES